MTVWCTVAFSPAQLVAVDLRLSWSPVQYDRPVGYNVYSREIGAAFDYRYPIWTDAATSCVLYGLADNTTHYFVVRTHDYFGNESADSVEVRWEPGDPATVADPTVAIREAASSCFINTLL